MKDIIISFENQMCGYAAGGIIKDPDFLGGDIDFLCQEVPGLGYYFSIYNDKNISVFIKEKLPGDLKNFLTNLNYEKF